MHSQTRVAISSYNKNQYLQEKFETHYQSMAKETRFKFNSTLQKDKSTFQSGERSKYVN